MKNPTHIAVDQILSAIQDNVGEDGCAHSFLFGEPGAPHWQKNLGVEIFVSERRLIAAANFIREHGAPHLRALSISEVESQISDFIHNFYWYISEDTFLQNTPGTYDKHVTSENKEKLSHELGNTDLFTPKDKLILYPLVTVLVDNSFSSRAFFLRNPAELEQEFEPGVRRWLAPNQFPPDATWKHRTETPLSWLGVYSPIQPSSEKIKAQVLASLALTQPIGYRHQFTGRKVFGGSATIDDSMSIEFGVSNTPPIGEDITVSDGDHKWMSVLSSKIAQPTKSDKRMLRALEYFYRAWPLGPSERFPWLCMTLDATFGESSHATLAVVEGVQGVLNIDGQADRLRDLMELRASTIHGGAPDVYDSRKYGRYYRKYAEDPIFDLGLIVAACLREKVFGGTLIEHPDPHAKLIAAMVTKGRIPPIKRVHSILGEVASK